MKTFESINNKVVGLDAGLLGKATGKEIFYHAALCACADRSGGELWIDFASRWKAGDYPAWALSGNPTRLRGGIDGILLGLSSHGLARRKKRGLWTFKNFGEPVVGFDMRLVTDERFKKKMNYETRILYSMLLYFSEKGDGGTVIRAEEKEAAASFIKRDRQGLYFLILTLQKCGLAEIGSASWDYVLRTVDEV